jgi:hypothetical protein
MNRRTLSLAGLLVASAALGGCNAWNAMTGAVGSAGSASGRSPTTEVSHPLDPRQRLDDHAARLADGVARYRDATGGRMPQTTRDLALQMANDGQPCFSEVLKDHWFQPYAYSVTSDARSTFQLVSAGANGALGDGDDLRVERGPGDAAVRRYGYTSHGD